VPEGGLGDVDAASLLSSLDMGNNYQFKASFKNISTSSFDSVKVLWKITDDKNRDSVLFDGLKKILGPGDTIIFDKTFDTRKLSPDNLISLSVNPQNSQPEQFMFNNYLQTRLKVNADVIPPLLDVTFDGVHILNGDIVSSKPNILIQLKDDNAYLPLNDTSLIKVRLRYPGGSLKTIRFDGDTLTFKPSENPSGGANNTASIQYKPILQMDGDYELMISAKDRSENSSGATDYSVMFQVTNQSMITNLLNYPNPFTTSTAFVFTLTGSELPTNMRIQILTITGKIVKEITLAELGPLKIGNNITDYKWDGRDQYGQLLANGVYLYRVITDIKGKKIDKLNRDQYNTDQYFKSGYGKMYLMR
jgi:flagellar hook assembly protein FlgD